MIRDSPCVIPGHEDGSRRPEPAIHDRVDDAHRPLLAAMDIESGMLAVDARWPYPRDRREISRVQVAEKLRDVDVVNPIVRVALNGPKRVVRVVPVISPPDAALGQSFADRRQVVTRYRASPR